jgi:2-C-methyl-D-erythritol 4-phosphate cytidylyltransferase
MLANCPKQYLSLHGQSILTHTLNKLLSHARISKVIVALSENDEYFGECELANHADIIRVTGGKERVDSVLNGLKEIDNLLYPWVLVHDAARPCLTHQDIDKLINTCLVKDSGGLLATPVRDTMKRGVKVNENLPESDSKDQFDEVVSTVERSQLWHALTPQMFKTNELFFAIQSAQEKSLIITDESSAMEQAGFQSLLVAGSSENIKITHPDDLALAAYYLNKQLSENDESH